MFALWSLYKLLWKTSCNIQTKAVRVEQSDKLLKGSERWGSVNSNPPDEDLLTSERLLKQYCILCRWHQLGHPKQVFIAIHRPLFFPSGYSVGFSQLGDASKHADVLFQHWHSQRNGVLDEGYDGCSIGPLWANQKVRKRASVHSEPIRRKTFKSLVPLQWHLQWFISVFVFPG